jgi:hypothetical protein
MSNIFIMNKILLYSLCNLYKSRACFIIPTRAQWHSIIPGLAD